MSELFLTISVPVEEYSYMQRRLKYLEAMLVRVVRDRKNIQEWFTAAEIAGKRLASLPTTADAVTRRARRERWPNREARYRGRAFPTYHVHSLPPRAFDDLIGRMLDFPALDDFEAIVLPALPDVPAPERKPLPENTAPPWVLPLVRIMKTETAGDLARAWEVLPERLPPGVDLPDVEEVANVLVALGLAG